MKSENLNAEGRELKEIHQRRFDRDFFDLQFKFAGEMQRITNAPLENCLLKYTNIYKRLRLGHDMNPENPKWKGFIKSLKNSEDGSELAAQFCEQAEIEKHDTKLESKNKSCFRYDYHPDTKTVKIHFDNNDSNENGPLSKERISTRKEELRKIFSEVRQLHPDAEKVKGSSWLYNLNSYRRLFPPQYTIKQQINPAGLNDLGMWGQFLDRDGHVKSEMEAEFFNRLKEVKSEEEVLDTFPYRKLDVECDIKYFYQHLGIE